MKPARLLELARANPVNAALLEVLPGLGLRQGHLTAGCLFQEVWNHQAGHPPGWGIRDYDVFYFDDRDLSFEAEDTVIRRVRQATENLAVEVEVRNQARVHLWYEQRFGPGYPQLRSARDGIDRYLVACTCIGIDLATGLLYAPNGLAEVAAGLLRPNRLNDRPELFRRKAEAYRARWPFLTIVEG